MIYTANIQQENCLRLGFPPFPSLVEIVMSLLCTADIACLSHDHNAFLEWDMKSVSKKIVLNSPLACVERNYDPE